MWNTCLIGRRWKPREGWSRPVLTGDGDIAAHSPLCGGGSASFSAAGLLATRSVVPVVTKRCSRPLSGSRTATVMMPEWFPFWSSVPFDYGFCGGHGPGVTPGPFPNPEAKAWHGDGTAPGRVWESNTPPQTFLLDPRRAFARRGFFVSTTNRHLCYIGVGELVESAIQGKRRADTRLPFVVCIRRIGPPL